jgi:hypothetical protein
VGGVFFFKLSIILVLPFFLVFLILILLLILILIFNIIIAMILAAGLFRPASLGLLGLLRELLLLSAAPLLLPLLAAAILKLGLRVAQALCNVDFRVLLFAGGGEVLILLGLGVVR